MHGKPHCLCMPAVGVKDDGGAVQLTVTAQLSSTSVLVDCTRDTRPGGMATRAMRLAPNCGEPPGLSR